MARSPDCGAVTLLTIGQDDSFEGRGAGAILSDTPELLEIILLHLSLKDILLAQRVNWAWRNTITSSPKLQQALFFRPITTDAVRFKHDWSNILDCPSKEYCSRLRERLDDLDEALNTWIWSGSGSSFEGQLLINPFLADGTPIQASRLPEPVMEPPKYTPNPHPAVTPSWRKMLLTQPPLVEMVVDHAHANHWHTFRARNPSFGVTGADVVESVVLFDTHLLYVFKDRCFRRLCPYTDQGDWRRLSGFEVWERLAQAHDTLPKY